MLVPQPVTSTVISNVRGRNIISNTGSNLQVNVNGSNPADEEEARGT